MNKDILKQRGFANEISRIEKGICPTCGKPLADIPFRNAISIKEYSISGMCQNCQDEIFGED